MKNNKSFKPENLDLLEQSHEELKQGFEESFGPLSDPRSEVNKIHKLIDLIFIIICAVIGGANNLKEIIFFMETHREWFSKKIDLSNGLPSYSTLWWILVLLPSEDLQECFLDWMNIRAKKLGDHIAIDGKALRGSKTKKSNFIHIVSAWASQFHITLAHEKVKDKSNEITAIPKVLQKMDVEDCTITIDAMGTQKTISQKIREAKADYILALKGNQGNLNDEVENFFIQAQAVNFEGINHDKYVEALDKKVHGRMEKRTVYATSDIDWLPKKEEWKDLKTLILIISERKTDGQSSIEKRMYISNKDANAKILGTYIRSHWSIENQCHWILDIAFREDDYKGRTGYLPENMTLIRRLALSLLKLDTTTKAGIEAKRKKAGWSTRYLEKILSFVKSFV